MLGRAAMFMLGGLFVDAYPGHHGHPSWGMVLLISVAAVLVWLTVDD